LAAGPVAEGLGGPAGFAGAFLPLVLRTTCFFLEAGVVTAYTQVMPMTRSEMTTRSLGQFTWVVRS